MACDRLHARYQHLHLHHQEKAFFGDIRKKVNNLFYFVIYLLSYGRPVRLRAVIGSTFSRF